MTQSSFDAGVQNHTRPYGCLLPRVGELIVGEGVVTSVGVTQDSSGKHFAEYSTADPIKIGQRLGKNIADSVIGDLDPNDPDDVDYAFLNTTAPDDFETLLDGQDGDFLSRYEIAPDTEAWKVAIRAATYAYLEAITGAGFRLD
jgi:hypothetical protein